MEAVFSLVADDDARFYETFVPPYYEIEQRGTKRHNMVMREALRQTGWALPFFLHTTKLTSQMPGVSSVKGQAPLPGGGCDSCQAQQSPGSEKELVLL